jgi:hypothetical protein
MVSTDSSDAGIIQSHQNGAPSEVRLMIHHQFPGIELVSPVYASDGATCCLSSDQKVDSGFTMQANFDIHPDQEDSIGILMYKLQRKVTDQNDEKAMSSEAACIHLVVIWKVDNYKEFWSTSHIIEHDKDCVWNRDRLMKLAKRCRLFKVRHCPIEDTWLMSDNIVLMTRENVTREEESYKLEMTLSKTSIKDDTRRPWYIDMDM